MAAVLRRMRGPPGALDGTGSSKVAGGGVTEKEAALQRNILMVELKMKQCFLLCV
jgi:hypothetical protein